MQVEIDLKPDAFIAKQFKVQIQGIDVYFPYKPYECQEKYLKEVIEALNGNNNALLESPTGTGKTLAFLIAALESALARRKGKKLTGKDIPIMVISPTRELALQIAEEAKKLLRLHSMKVGVAVGGTSRFHCLRTVEEYRVDILVGTPGRIIDVLNSSEKAKQKVSSLDTVRLLF